MFRLYKSSLSYFNIYMHFWCMCVNAYSPLSCLHIQKLTPSFHYLKKFFCICLWVNILIDLYSLSWHSNVCVCVYLWEREDNFVRYIYIYIYTCICRIILIYKHIYSICIFWVCIIVFVYIKKYILRSWLYVFIIVTHFDILYFKFYILYVYIISIFILMYILYEIQHWHRNVNFINIHDLSFSLCTILHWMTSQVNKILTYINIC